MADIRVFLDANVLFTAAYSPTGLSALLVELGVGGCVTLLTSRLAVFEAHRNLQMKRPEALPGLERSLAAIQIVEAPAVEDVERLTPADLSAQDRPILAAAVIAGATHFVTGDRRDFGRWMSRGTSLPLRIMTPRQFLTEVRPH